MTGVSDSPTLPVARVTYQRRYLIETRRPAVPLGHGYMSLFLLLSPDNPLTRAHTYTHTRLRDGRWGRTVPCVLTGLVVGVGLVVGASR